MSPTNIESKASPLWAKPGAGIEQGAMAFMSRDDVLLDRELFHFDIQATRAHVHGLNAIDLIGDDEARSIDGALDALADRFRSGAFVLDERYEDGHTAIESFLVEHLGETGKRVHLGRSRNDQVAVALRLYMLDVLDQAKGLCLQIANAALTVARTHEMDPMPGYTHLQRAVPSSVGLWMGSFAESFADAAHLCALTRSWLDASPLGTAAGYGVNLPLARDQVSDEQGFARVQINPMATQAARGRLEHQVIATLWQAMQEVRRLAWDYSLFSSQEFGFVTLASGFVTGSSIMPNKKNPDMAELLRASTAVVGGALAEIQQTMSLPSGYQRDLQITKPALIRAVKVSIEALSHIPRLIETATLHTERMRDAIDPTMFATDHAVKLASEGMAFRDAYVQAAQSIGDTDASGVDIDASVRERVSPGGCGNLMLDAIEARLTQLAEGA
ncbi:MAG TPA: argininosuccinate lyase [Phycisphaerales bacterium]|nr:argininosuccinate lyase [Phycisphaerales bacterium]